MKECPCGCQFLDIHVCNVYCCELIHTDLVYTTLPYDHMSALIEDLQFSYDDEWVCKLRFPPRILGVKLALEAPESYEKFPEQQEIMGEIGQVAYLFTFTQDEDFDEK